MRVLAAAFGLLVVLTGGAAAQFRVPDCAVLRSFSADAFSEASVSAYSDFIENFGIQLYELTPAQVVELKRATTVCALPNEDPDTLNTRWDEAYAIAAAEKADIELEIAGDQEEYRSSQPSSSSPAPGTGSGSGTPDERAVLLPTFFIIYQMAELCSQNQVAFNANDVSTIDQSIRTFIDEGAIGDEIVERLWVSSANVFEPTASQMTEADCLQTRQQATMFFKLPDSTRPNPFAR